MPFRNEPGRGGSRAGLSFCATAFVTAGVVGGLVESASALHEADGASDAVGADGRQRDQAAGDDDEVDEGGTDGVATCSENVSFSGLFGHRKSRNKR
jgi:hypothetical protein